MNEVKQLYGMSAIRKNQIIEVMKKILSVYKEKNNNRNLIISPEDFKYIFEQGNRDEDSLDNKVKTVLLMIEKDFSSPNKLGFSPFVARQRSLFGTDLIFVSERLEKRLLHSDLGKYFVKKYNIVSTTYSSVFQVNLSGIWERYYKHMSFPSFKYSLFNDEARTKLKHKAIFEEFIFATGVEIGLNSKEDNNSIISFYNQVLESFESFINTYKISEKHFTTENLGSHFKRTLNISDIFEARAFAQTILNATFEFTKIKEVKFLSEKAVKDNTKPTYKVNMDGDLFSQFIRENIYHSLKPKNNYIEIGDHVISFHHRGKTNPELDAKIAALGIAESKNKISYQTIGGNNPQIYIRMNAVFPLENAIKEGDFYKNNILSDVQKKHYTSVEMLNYLFTKKQEEKQPKKRVINYTNWFWETVEDYFMGIIPDEVNDELNRRKR